MEIWKDSEFLESTARLVAAQTQARLQVVEIPFQQDVALMEVDHGEMLITVLKGEGTIRSREDENSLKAGDQVYLLTNDAFGLTSAGADTSFVVQIYWDPDSIEL